MDRRQEPFGFALGTLLGVALIRIVLAIFPWFNPAYGGIYIHHAYVGLIGFMLFSLLLLYFIDDRFLRFLFSVFLGMSFSAILDEFNLFIVAGGGVFSYSSSFKYIADSVAISIGIAVLLISRIHLRKKRL